MIELRYLREGDTLTLQYRIAPGSHPQSSSTWIDVPTVVANVREGPRIRRQHTVTADQGSGMVEPYPPSWATEGAPEQAAESTKNAQTEG